MATLGENPVTAAVDAVICTVKASDMTPDIKKEAVRSAKVAVFKAKLSERGSAKFDSMKRAAKSLKRRMDKKYGPSWHCIVGDQFSSIVTHEFEHYLYVYCGAVAILLFKSA